MTRKEITHKRSLYFSQWIRNNLPDSNTGFCVSDLDFILWNWRTKKIMLLEIKTKNAICRQSQYQMWKFLNKWLQKGIDEEWRYYGFHLIQFENNNFNDGKCFFDKKEITENKLIEILSFKEDVEIDK